LFVLLNDQGEEYATDLGLLIFAGKSSARFSIADGKGCIFFPIAIVLSGKRPISGNPSA
jgi:hypothetical protein